MDVKFYEFVFPFKMISNDVLDSSFTNTNDPWDPFSSDKLLLSDSLIDGYSNRAPIVSNQDGEDSLHPSLI